MKTAVKKRSSKLRILASSFIMLLVSVIALASSTYAWFANANSGSVENIDITAAAATGIELSVDPNGGVWKSIITRDDIVTDAIFAKVPQNGQLLPVSSPTIGTGTTDYEFFNGSLRNSGNLNTTAYQWRSGAAANLFAFDLYIKTSQSVYLDITKLEFEATAGNAQGENAGTFARVACVQFQSIAGTGETSIESAINQTTVAMNKTYEPWATTHVTGSGISTATAVTTDGVCAAGYAINIRSGTTGYGLTRVLDENDANYQESTTWHNTVVDPVTTLQVVATPGTALGDNSYLRTVTGNVTVEPTDANPMRMAAMSAGITKVTFIAWLEGQDVDCMNSVAGQNMRLGIGLKASESAGA